MRIDPIDVDERRAIGASAPVWLLLGPRPGDNNQALALGEALGLPFVVKTLDYNWLQRFSLRLPPTLASLRRSRRAALCPPWPELVIAVGRRSVPVARWIKRRSGGRTRIVRIGHPRQQADLFDLVDRGELRPGAFADVVVFDPATVAPGPIRRVADFPANSERLTADAPSGVRHVLVNGTPIRVDEQQVDAASGRMVAPGRS